MLDCLQVRAYIAHHQVQQTGGQGYPSRVRENSSNYRLYDCTSKKVTVAKHVIFQKDSEEATVNQVEEDDIFLPLFEGGQEEQVEAEEDEAPDQRQDEAIIPMILVEKIPNVPAPREQLMQQPRNLRDRNCIRKSSRYEVNTATIKTPCNFQEAVTGPNAVKWRKAIDKELQAHHKNST